MIIILYGQDAPPKVKTDVTVVPTREICEQLRKNVEQNLKAGKNVQIFTDCKELDVDKARAMLRPSTKG